jgi:PEP-CTERM motif
MFLPRTSSFPGLAICLCVSALTAPVTAQPFTTTIINVPPDPAPSSIGSDTQLNLFDIGLIGSNFNAGASDGSSTNVQFNMTGGIIVSFFQANTGSTINLSGGNAGNFFNANAGSLVNFTGGQADSLFQANPGSTVNFSGGSAGLFFNAHAGSAVNLIGAEFQLDGVPIAGLTTPGDTVGFNLPDGSILTGTHPDGSVFIFSSLSSDSIDDGTLTLTAATVPVATPGVINVPADTAPPGLRTGQTLNLANGGIVGNNFAALDATLNINGGTIGRNLEVVNTALSVTDGSVGSNFIAGSGTVVTITGGTLGGATDANLGSTFNISGGTVGGNFRAKSGSSVSLSGGTVGRIFTARPGSSVNLIGGEFQLDGVPVAGLVSPGDSTILNLPDGSVLTGTHPDGAVFIFSSLSNDSIDDGTLTLTLASIPATPPGVIDVPTDASPIGLRAGQTLNLDNGGTLSDNFAAVNATLNINGGNVGVGLEITNSTLSMTNGTVNNAFDAGPGSLVNISGGTVGGSSSASFNSTVNITGGSLGGAFRANNGSTVNISGGTVGSIFNANSGSTVNISGGIVGDIFQANDGSIVNISGGSVGSIFTANSGSTINISDGVVADSFQARNGSTVNISGGQVGRVLVAHSGSTVDISGGSLADSLQALSGSNINITGGIIGEDFHAFSGSEINLTGLSFILDGIDLTTSLILGDPLLITDRDVILEGLLSDGSPFSFDLNSTNSPIEDFFDTNATLTITLVPEPGTLSLIGIGALSILRRRRLN